MKKLRIIVTRDQQAAISGLAYWIAESAYTRERGTDPHDEMRCHNTIMDIFEELDHLAIPFWVQNSVIAFSRNWRDYASKYLWVELEKRGIYRAPAQEVSPA